MILHNKHVYTPYDYCSIMHYHSNNGVEGGTKACQMAPKNPFSCVIKNKIVTKLGELVGLSEMDIEGINERYGCQG